MGVSQYIGFIFLIEKYPLCTNMHKDVYNVDIFIFFQ
jgi:hypothetical protein